MTTFQRRAYHAWFVLCGPILTTIGILLCNSSVVAQSPVVFMSDDIAANTSELSRFDNGAQTSAVTNSPARYQGITVLNGNVLVANFQSHTIDTFSPAGTFLGAFSTPSVNPVYLESDGAGNVYTCSGSIPGFGVAVRMNSSGLETQQFTGTGQFHGIDADATGNVYVGQLTSTAHNLLKFAPNGSLLNTTSLGVLSSPGDIAIDEAGNRLFLADGVNGLGIKIFDIAGAAPVLTGSIVTPFGALIRGVHYAAESGNIFALDTGDFSGDPRGLEYSPAGVLLREYRPTGAVHAGDITTFVPEPSSFALLVIGLFGFARYGRRR
jgi:DNA-binding beta-propeller fold protein YncE